MQKGPIGLAATANIFLGQLEAPLLIKPYLNKMNQRFAYYHDCRNVDNCGKCYGFIHYLVR